MFGKLVQTSGSSIASPPVFRNYQEALVACNGCDYEFEQIVETVFRKTVKFRDVLFRQNRLSVNQQDTQLLLATELASRNTSRETLRVLDHGGACGAHYFTAKAYYGNERKLKWCVVETGAMAARAKGLETEELKFYSNLGAALRDLSTPHLVFSSGTLQCVPKPYETLQELLTIGAQHLFLNRLGLNSASSDVVTVHSSWLRDNGPGPLPEGVEDREVKYPFQFISREKLDQAIGQQYEIKLRFDDPSGMFQVGNAQIVGCGYLCETK